MKKPAYFAGFTLYRIYYGNRIVYLGRTMQPLQNRIRGHLFKKPMHREIDINLVSKIEYAGFQSQSDMYLYEIYFINLWKPELNKDDKAPDHLTIVLPDVEWKPFSTPLWERWKKEIERKNISFRAERNAKIETTRQRSEIRQKYLAGEISEEEYYDFLDTLF